VQRLHFLQLRRSVATAGLIFLADLRQHVHQRIDVLGAPFSLPGRLKRARVLASSCHSDEIMNMAENLLHSAPGSIAETMTKLLALPALLLAGVRTNVPGEAHHPDHPVPAGGSTDIVGRIAADGMGRELGQPFVVDNRGGAGGAIGAKANRRRLPDGYTLGIATISTHVVNPIVRTDLRYDSLKDFSSSAQIAAVPNWFRLPSVHAQNMPSSSPTRKAPRQAQLRTPGIGSLATCSAKRIHEILTRGGSHHRDGCPSRCGSPGLRWLAAGAGAFSKPAILPASTAAGRTR